MRKSTIGAIKAELEPPIQATVQATRYRYDPLGRRIEKADAFGATPFAYDGDLLAYEERGLNGLAQ